MALVCWFPLDDTTLANKGTGALTFSESNTTTTANGRIGKCRTFNGNTSYVAVAGADLYNCFTGGAQPFSIAFWVYNGDGNASSGDAYRAVFFGDYGLTGAKNINLEKTAAGLVRFYWTADTAVGAMSNTTLTASAWSHVCVTYSGTVFKCYINGVEKYSKTVTLSALAKTTGDFYLGRDNRTGNTAFNGRMNDFRVYNHCLSIKEIRDLNKCLLVHYALDFEDKYTGTAYPTAAFSETGTDNSGNSGPVGFYNIAINSDTAVGTNSAKFNGSSSYIEKTIPGWLPEYTFMCWAKFDATGTYHLMDCRNSANSQGMQPMYCGLTYGIQFYSINGGSLTPGASQCGWTSSDTNKWFHITGVITATNCTIYVNGAQVATSTTPKTNTAWGELPLRVGTRLNGQYWFNGKVADVKVFGTALSADDILTEYKRKAAIDRNGKLFVHQLTENATKIVLPNSKSVTKNQVIAETMTLSDGSMWVPVCVHNVAVGVLGGMSQAYYYQDTQRWTNFGVLNDQPRPESGQWEFYVMQQTAVDGAFSWFRFKQNVNPIGATWDQVNPSKVGTNVTRIAASTTNSYAGMYWIGSSNEAMCFANGTNGNWYGCGVKAAYQGGIPGYNGQIVKGWQIVYMRISTPKTRLFKNGLVITNEIVEN